MCRTLTSLLSQEEENMSTRNNLISPPDFRYRSWDEHLLVYLKQQVDNSNCNSDPIVHCVNIYNHHPQELADMYMGSEGNVLFFLTPRTRRYQNGTRPNRKVANKGFWKATGQRDIKIAQQGFVGKKMVLVFYEGRPKDGKKTNWIMHEYRIKDYQRPISNGEDCMKLDDYVLTKIRLNERPSKRDDSRIPSDQELEAADEDRPETSRYSPSQEVAASDGGAEAVNSGVELIVPINSVAPAAGDMDGYFPDGSGATSNDNTNCMNRRRVLEENPVTDLPFSFSFPSGQLSEIAFDGDFTGFPEVPHDLWSWEIPDFINFLNDLPEV